MGDGQEEEIIIIEDSDATSNTAASSESQTEEKSSANKKKFLYIGIGVGVVILLAVIAFFVTQKLQKKHAELPSTAEQKIEQDITEPVEPSKIENMIAKADYLYSTGSKDEALYLYEKIAHYSEAVSAYNLGVAQLKDAQYETALASFQKAIQNNEKRCVYKYN